MKRGFVHLVVSEMPRPDLVRVKARCCMNDGGKYCGLN